MPIDIVLNRKSSSLRRAVFRAAQAINLADGILITAGAGMGVDSNLPDFRGKNGFWKAYPQLKRLGIQFEQMANPDWFDTHPEMAWAFYGHRYNLYRNTTPHSGFDILRNWASKMDHSAFVFTSNVDGHFQKAGFSSENVCECHGSINYLQCTKPCDGTWRCNRQIFDVQLDTLSISGDIPRCSSCNALARPNIKMFNDWCFLPTNSKKQKRSLNTWLENFKSSNLVIIEIGAGSSVPTVRWHSHIYSETFDAPLIRINPLESHGLSRTISIPLGGLDALQLIDETLVSF